MRPLRVAAVLLAAVSTAAAARAEAPKPGVGRYIDISATALPILWRHRLVNYVFVKLRVILAPNVNSADYLSKEPFLRDALVRIGYRTPFMVPGDLTRVDESALRRAMLAEANRILGPGRVVGVVVVMQTPQRLSGLPH